MPQRDPFDDTPVSLSSPSISFPSLNIGDKVTGIILPVPNGENEGKAYSWEPQRGPGGVVKRFRPSDGQTEGDPMMNTVIWFLTDYSDWTAASLDFVDRVKASDEPQTDDGSRRWFIKGGKKSDHNAALMEALAALGAKRPEIGQTITIEYVRSEGRVVESGDNKGEKYRAPIAKVTLTASTPDTVQKANAWYQARKAADAAKVSDQGDAFDAGADGSAPPF